MRYILLFSVIFLVGCGPEVLFEESHSVGEEWSYDETMDFEIDIVDTTELYNLEFILDHKTDYTYQNIYVNISTTYPGGKQISDEVSLQLANKRGQFVGKCNGETCKATIVLQEKFKFQLLGKHTISIAQHSRKNSLDGISKGALKLIKYKGV